MPPAAEGRIDAAMMPPPMRWLASSGAARGAAAMGRDSAYRRQEIAMLRSRTGLDSLARSSANTLVYLAPRRFYFGQAATRRQRRPSVPSFSARTFDFEAVTSARRKRSLTIAAAATDGSPMLPAEFRRPRLRGGGAQLVYRCA